MTDDARVRSIVDMGFTERQARFLAFEAAASPANADALARGAGRIEMLLLSHSYGRLSPLVGSA